MTREYHPASNIFPLMQGAEFEALLNDIDENGQREPIYLHEDGRIIDGRNRYRACVELGIEPYYETFIGDDDELVRFVISLNLHRRHLNESQRAMVATRVATLERGVRQDRSIDLSTQSQAAELLNVSVPSIKRARVVDERGAPGLVHAVEKGEVSVSLASQIAALPEEVQTEIVARGRDEILKAAKRIKADEIERKRETRRAEIAEYIAAKESRPIDPCIAPTLVLADPPWQYDFAESETRAIENHYPTATLDEIISHAPDTHKDCILLLWATAPKLQEALRVLNSWGFDYKTCAIWDKMKIGMGYWFRGQHEILLVGVKGNAKPPEDTERVSSIFAEERTRHSAKPECVYSWIERAFPMAEKLEMYCRSPREGWHAWGNMV